MRLRWWRKRWVIVLVGCESGHVTQLPFLSFTTENEARRWAMRLNEGHNDLGLTIYEHRRLQ